MPKAVIDMAATQRYELKSAPPDGYVVLRRLTYGQWLQRQSDAMMTKVARDGNNKGSSLEAEVTMMARKVAVYEFSMCVVEHNLEGLDGQLLDFRKEYTLDILDPRVGQEIGDYIQQMNALEEAEAGN